MIPLRTIATIATATAAAGTVATGILAAKAASNIAQQNRDLLGKSDLLKVYAPAAIAGAVTITAIGFLGYSTTELGNRLVKEVASHALTVAAGQRAMLALERKAKELVGPKKTQQLRDIFVEEEQRVRTNPNDPQSLHALQSSPFEPGDTLCYDRFSGRYFRSSAEAIRAAVNDLNKDVLAEIPVSMNDVHDALGLDQTSIGHYFENNGDLIEVNFTSTVVGQDAMCLVVEYKNFVTYPACGNCMG